MMSKLRKNLLKLSNDASGSFKTRADRDRHLTYLSDFLRLTNINIEHITQLKASHVKAYIEYRKVDCKVGEGTLTNEMASIRKVLREAKRHQLVNLPEISNVGLGINGRSRLGTKLPIPNDILNGYIEAALNYDAGFGCMLLLGFQLGLRDEEACQSYKSIKTWFQNVNNNESIVTVIFGTKGGRPRDAIILNREVLKETLAFCVEVMKRRNGYLIDKENLQKAMSFLSNAATSIGLTGQYSFMSARYTYTNLLIQKNNRRPFSEQEKLALASTALGHSSGRVNYVKSVYGRILLTDQELHFDGLIINYPTLPPINPKIKKELP